MAKQSQKGKSLEEEKSKVAKKSTTGRGCKARKKS